MRDSYSENTMFRVYVLFFVYLFILCGLLLAKARGSLWLDEAYSVTVARGSLNDLIKSLKADTWPPLYYVLLWLWIKLWGDSEQSARALSIILFLSCLLATHKFLVKHLYNERIALFGVWLMSTFSLSVAHATNARGYMLLCLFSLLSTDSALSLMRHSHARVRLALTYAVACYGGMMTHYSFVYVMLSHIVLAVLRYRHRVPIVIAPLLLGIVVFGSTWGNILVQQMRFGVALGIAWMKPTSWVTVLRNAYGSTGSDNW